MIQALSVQGLREHWESAVGSPMLERAKEEFHRLL